MANAFIWLIVENSLQYLPKRYQVPNLKFKRIIDATLKDIQRWERCLDYTNGFLQYAVDALQAKHYIKDEIKADVQSFFNQIRDGVISNIRSSNWLNQTILDEIVEKIETVVPIIGYRDEVLNETNLINNYKHFWPIDGLGERKIFISAKYFDSEYRKTHPIEGMRFFELALLMEDRKYLGQFRKLLEPDLLDYEISYRNIESHNVFERNTKYVSKSYQIFRNFKLAN